MRLDLYGEVTVSIGTTPQGQGHETTAAQVTADILGMSPDMVHVAAGYNKAANTYVGFSGTYASQFAVTGLGAVDRSRREAARRDRPRRGVHARGRGVRYRARRRVRPPRGQPGGGDPVHRHRRNGLRQRRGAPGELADSVTLNCRYVYRPPFAVPDPETKTGQLTLTYASQVHAAVIELDEETGQVAHSRLRRRRRVRAQDQPEDRRGPGPRRDRPRDRRGAVRVARLRR